MVESQNPTRYKILSASPICELERELKQFLTFTSSDIHHPQFYSVCNKYGIWFDFLMLRLDFSHQLRLIGHSSLFCLGYYCDQIALNKSFFFFAHSDIVDKMNKIRLNYRHNFQFTLIVEVQFLIIKLSYILPFFKFQRLQLRK